ncbi:PEP/pyruvate-binding domain-containing protein, partial [Endozoicomonas sp. ISHI1]|uniref:PEP/pyruvate-binding domain-containing protein n=1 Tax=Endozoicomonas sp. ISHI1 TaxID=2825882 RepID=UPI002148638D
MLKSIFDYVTASFQRLTTDPNQVTEASRSPNRSPKRYFSDLNPGGVPDPTPLTKRACRSPVSNEAADCSPASREQLGGKGMFLQRMKEAGFRVPPFECVTAHVMNALEQHPLDTRGLEHYFPGIGNEPEAEISLANIRECLNALPLSEQAKRDSWLTGVAKFIASEDFYKQVKDSEAARHIRDHGLLTSQPLIVRSSGINEDNYGDAQAGKYLSLVQEEDDILRTCLKVMASGYRPEVCPGVIPPPMALIIQQCIDCRYGGVAMSFQSFQDKTVRIEYTPGQPRGVVAGQSGNTPHRIDIYREGLTEEAGSSQYFPGMISSHFVLHKNNNGYSETSIDDADTQSNDVEQQLSDDMVSELRRVVTELENLLLCPVDVEFAIDHQGRLFLLQVRPVTRLSGGMDFAMPIPQETLAIGEGVSEGFCTGPLWLARKQAAGSMPEGAIVVAQHAEDWMLEPDFLERAGGFVTATGGFNDHVAILMKQKRKTLMLA